MECAAVHPSVIEGDVMKVNGPCLNVLVLRPKPVQTVSEISIKDVGHGVVIVKNLRKNKKQTNRKCINIVIIHGRTGEHACSLLEFLLTVL